MSLTLARHGAPVTLAALSADLLALLHLDPHQAMVGGHPDRGLLLAQARLKLERLAVVARSSAVSAARLVLDAVRRPPSAQA